MIADKNHTYLKILLPNFFAIKGALEILVSRHVVTIMKIQGSKDYYPC